MASALPPDMASALLAAARGAFVDGMHVAAAIAAVVGLGLAIFAFVSLRGQGEELPAAEPETIERPLHAPAPTPARECF